MSRYDHLLLAVPALAVLLQGSPSYGGAGSTGGSITTSTDLGIVATSVQVNGTVYNSAQPSTTDSFTYNQLLFPANDLNIQVTDSGGNQTTVGNILAYDLGPSNNGTFSYNFPPYGSGTLAQISTGSFTSPSDPALLFEVTSRSGPSALPIGSFVNLNPLDPADVFNTLSGPFAPPLSNGNPTASAMNLPPQISLGMAVYPVSIGGNVFETIDNSLYGEVQGTTWQEQGSVSGVVSTPEPCVLWIILAGTPLLLLRRSAIQHPRARSGRI